MSQRGLFTLVPLRKAWQNESTANLCNFCFLARAE